MKISHKVLWLKYQSVKKTTTRDGVLLISSVIGLTWKFENNVGRYLHMSKINFPTSLITLRPVSNIK